MSAVAHFRAPNATERLSCMESYFLACPPYHFFGPSAVLHHRIERLTSIYYDPAAFADASVAAHWAFQAIFNHADVWPESLWYELLADQQNADVSPDDLLDRHLHRLQFAGTLPVQVDLPVTLINDSAPDGTQFRIPTDEEVSKHGLTPHLLSIPAPQRFFGVTGGAPQIFQRFAVWTTEPFLDHLPARLSLAVFGFTEEDAGQPTCAWKLPFTLHWQHHIQTDFADAIRPRLHVSPLQHVCDHLGKLYL
jgi:hypothetical protein